MRYRPFAPSFAVALVVALAGAASAQYTWVGGHSSGGDPPWNDATNWNPSTSFPNSAGATVTFDGGGLAFSNNVNITGSVQAQSITFTNPTGAYALLSSAGQTLSGVKAISVAAGITGTQTINLANIAGGSLLYASGNNLTITNNAALGASPTLVIGPNTVIATTGVGWIAVDGAGFTQISGAVVASTHPISIGLSKTGAGTLTLSNTSNSYLGGTVINAGTLAVAADGCLGNPSGSLSLKGGTLQITGTGVITALSASRTVTLSAAGGTIDTSGLGAAFGNVTTIASLITGNGPLTLNAHGDTSDSGNGSNSELILSGTNVSTGTVTINSGVVDAASKFGDAANAISINGVGGLVDTTGAVSMSRSIVLSGTGDRIFRVYGSSQLALSGVISGPGSLRKTDIGTLVLSGANTYTGGTTIGAGILAVAGDGNLGAMSGGLTLTAGTLEATATFSSGRGVNVTGVGGTVSVDSSATLTLSGTLSGAGALTKSGTGTLTLTGSGNSIASLTVGGGGVSLGAGALTLTDATSPLNVGGGSAAALTVSGGAVVATTATGTVALIDGPLGTGAVVAGAGSQLNTGYSLYVGNSAHGTMTVENGGAAAIAHDLVMGANSGSAGTLLVQSGGTVTSVFAYVGLSSGSTGTATVTGAGSLYHVASQSFVGFDGAGSLTVQNGGAVVADTQFVVGFDNGSAGTLLVQSGGTVTTSLGGFLGANPGSTGTATVTGAGSVWSSPNALVLGRNGNAIGGIGQLTIANGGAVTAGNILFGTTGSSITVNGGTLTATSLNTLSGTTPGIFLTDPAGSAALTLGAANTLSTYTGPIADAAGGPGTVLKATNGTLTLTGHLTNTGGYRATGGTLVFSGAVVQPGPGSLTADSGATLKYDNGARVFGGFLHGPGTHVVTGGAAFTGTSSNPSAFTSVIGPATFTDFSNSGAFSVAAGLTAVPSLSSFINQGSGSITIGAASKVNAADFQSYGLLTISPAASGPPTLLTNSGSAPLFFNGGSRTFIGTPATAGNNLAGLDLHGQNLVIAGGLFVNNGFVADSTATAGSVVVDFGALYKGAGTNFVPVVTQNGGKVQAGNCPGSMGFGRFVFGPGGVNNYIFAIDNATGTAGPSPDTQGLVSGWGLVKAVRAQFGATTSSGDFVWTATSSDRLTVAIDTLINPTTVGTDVPGMMANFDPAQSYAWPAARWDGTYSGPTDVATLDAATSFDTSRVLNPIVGAFGWSLDVPDHTLSLTYTPTAVPEPGTLALAGMAAIGWVTFWRRRWGGAVG